MSISVHSNEKNFGSGSIDRFARFQAMKVCFEPNYTLSIDQVYIKSAIAAIQSLLAFNVLHYTEAFRRLCDENTDKPLPTWIPNWRCFLLHKPLMRATTCGAAMPNGMALNQSALDRLCCRWRWNNF